jgi:hypothetical protein
MSRQPIFWTFEGPRLGEITPAPHQCHADRAPPALLAPDCTTTSAKVRSAAPPTANANRKLSS